MNFFAHYYFHHKPSNHWHNAGLLFPDLLRIFTKEQRITENKFKPHPSLHLDLSEGIMAHFKDDEIFHNWAWFKEMNHHLALEIRQSNLGFKRDWFIAHIFIELAIDHLLVRENEEKVGQLYIDLNRCEKPQWLDFFDENNFGEIDYWFESYSKFISYRYIFTYKATTDLVYALQRIYERTGNGNFSNLQSQFLLVLLNNFIPELKKKLVELDKIL